jgi:hypothetical protein
MARPILIFFLKWPNECHFQISVCNFKINNGNSSFIQCFRIHLTIYIALYERVFGNITRVANIIHNKKVQYYKVIRIYQSVRNTVYHQCKNNKDTGVYIMQIIYSDPYTDNIQQFYCALCEISKESIC